MIIMHVNHSLTRQSAARAGGAEFLTVNMVMPAVDHNAKEAASFGRLLLALSALALERFGAARENQRRDTLPESALPCLAGIPVDPFDGQLLRVCQADTGCQLHSADHDATATPIGERDWGVKVVDSTLL